MDEIRDCLGRLACKGDAVTGEIETLYKGCRTRLRLPVGERFTVERERTVTHITRLASRAFRVESGNKQE